jgi:ankyrin repeat protein
MVALNTKVLERLRFFGPYGAYSKEMAKKFEEKRTAKYLQYLGLYKLPQKLSDNATDEEKKKVSELKKLYNSYSLSGFQDVPQNYVAALIQTLFSSPDGAIFTATVRPSQQDPLNILVKNDEGQIDLTGMNLLLKQVIGLQEALRQKKTSEENENAIFKLLTNMSMSKEDAINELKALKWNQKNADKFLKLHFALTLIEAVKEEIGDTKIQQLYPKNICMIALLGYVWKVANKKSDLAALTILFKDDAVLKDEDVFSHKEYLDEKSNFLQKFQKNLKVTIGPNIKESSKNRFKVSIDSTEKLSPETIALFRLGYSTYEERFPEPVSYKHNVKFSGYDGGYPDCGETSLRNFFYYAFNQNGKFSQDLFDQFVQKLKIDEKLSNKLEELKTYFQKYPSTSSGATQKAHDDWSEIVSGLKLTGSSCPYKSGKNNKECVCNIAGKRGLFNILSVMGQLIPDAKLAEEWKTEENQKFNQMTEKLSRLCELISYKEVEVDWNIDSKQKIMNETDFTVTFTVNQQKAFLWHFMSSHFQIEKIRGSGWPDKISWANAQFSHPLLQSWFVKPADLVSENYPPASLIFGQDLRNNDTIIQIADYIFTNDNQAFYPLVIKWLNPLFGDEHSLKQVTAMMIGHGKQFKLFTDEQQSQIQEMWEEISQNDLFFDYILNYGYLASLKTLIEKNKKLVNAKDKDGNTPLYRAAANGHDQVVQLLLDKGAEIDAKNKYGGTPLYRAAANGHDQVVQLLLDKGAEIDAKDEYVQTPLYRAAENGHDQVVQLLLDKGAEVNSKEKYGQTPLYRAAANGHDQVVQLLLDKGAEIDAKDEYDKTPLYRAAANGHDQVVQLLLDKGAEVNSKDKYGATPLYWAAYYGHDQVVQLLLDKGAKVNAKDEDGYTPLYRAAANGQDQVVQLLLDKGAEVNSKDKYGATPLYWAAYYGQDQVVQLLLDKGAEIDAKDEDDKTPLYRAAANGQDQVVQLLLDKGAEVNSKDKYGATPLYRAAYYGHDKVVQLLLDKGAKVNAKDEDGKTPLYWAAANGQDQVVQLLLDKGAEVNSKNKYGKTPLYWAAYNGHDKVVQLLLAKGALVEEHDIFKAKTDEIKKLLREAFEKQQNKN